MAPPRRLRLREGLDFETALWGAWRLVRRLGRGGNGEVWLARSRHGSVEVALKALTRLRGDGYDRFRREVGVLEQALFTDIAVLPIITAHLPDEIDPAAPPYYCMPVATRIAHALRDASPREIVSAVTGIAEGLVRLAAEQGIDSHRDIKPDNLFFHEGRPVIGDFGLVLQDEGERITRVGHVIGGAREFVPNEVRMRRDDI